MSKSKQVEQKLVITKNGLQLVEEKTISKQAKINYLKMPSTEPSTAFKEVGDRVARKELKYAHFGTENGVGTYFYEILNTENNGIKK